MEGLLPEHFPAGKPGTVYKSCLLCPRCYRSCKRLQSKKPTNPGRFFYKCPVPETDHKYFKWEDEARPHEFIQVPLTAVVLPEFAGLRGNPTDPMRVGSCSCVE